MCNLLRALRCFEAYVIPYTRVLEYTTRKPFCYVTQSL